MRFEFSKVNLYLTIDNKYYVTEMGNYDLTSETMRVESINTIIFNIIFRKVMEVKVRVVKF